MEETVLIDFKNDTDQLPIDPDELPAAFDQDEINTDIMGLYFSLLEVLQNTPSQSRLGHRITDNTLGAFLCQGVLASRPSA